MSSPRFISAKTADTPPVDAGAAATGGGGGGGGGGAAAPSADGGLYSETGIP